MINTAIDDVRTEKNRRFTQEIKDKLHWGIYILLVVSLFSALSVEVGPFTVRPDQIVVVVLAPILLFRLLTQRQAWNISRLDLLIAAYLVINIVSSLLHSPDRRMSLQRCLLLAITFSAFFITSRLIRTESVLKKIVYLLLTMGVLQAVFAIISVVLFSFGINTGGVQSLTARGTLLEPNLFGSFVMMIALILFAMIFNTHFKGQENKLVLLIVIVLNSLIMSLTRSAWLGLVFGLLFYAVFLSKDFFQHLGRNIAWLVLIGVLTVSSNYLISSSLRVNRYEMSQLYKVRAKQAIDYRSTTVRSRIQVWQAAVKLWKQNPVFGNGTDSLKVLGKGQNIPMFGDGYWIHNSLLIALHDTGIIGLLLYLAIQLELVVILWKAKGRTKDSYYQMLLGGFIVAFLAAQFTYVFTPQFWLIFIWCFMGIAFSLARLSQFQLRNST